MNVGCSAMFIVSFLIVYSGLYLYSNEHMIIVKVIKKEGFYV